MPMASARSESCDADIAVADDAERLAADLVAAVGRLVPAARHGRRPSAEDPAQQHDDLADHQLGHAAGVGERRVEDRDAAAARGVEVDLVGADREAADRDQPVGGLEDPRVICVRERMPSMWTPLSASGSASPSSAFGRPLEVGVAGACISSTALSLMPSSSRIRILSLGSERWV